MDRRLGKGEHRTRLIRTRPLGLVSVDGVHTSCLQYGTPDVSMEDLSYTGDTTDPIIL